MSIEAVPLVTCSHHYSVPKGCLLQCLLCGELFQKKPHDPNVRVAMPPQVFNITEEMWELARPWERIPFSVVQKFGWYVSLIGSDEYLIMPVLIKGEPRFFSARRLTDNGGLKYTYPVGIEKLPWRSQEELESPIVVCEGVADAAYSSLVYSSTIALLGNFYDADLDEKLRGKQVVIALDGDPVGITSAVRIATDLVDRSICEARVCIFPVGKEPTDFSIPDLREIYADVVR